MIHDEQRKNPERELKNIFITRRLNETLGDFVKACKYSRSFETLKNFLNYLECHEIKIEPITNSKRKVPEDFIDILVSGFPFRASNPYGDYINKAIDIFSPIFLIPSNDIPCDFVELSEKWEKNEEGIKFNCFIRKNEMQISERNKRDWEDSKIQCPKYNQLDEEVQKQFDEKGSPCINPEYYCKESEQFLNAINTIYNRFSTVQTKKIIPLTRFSVFVDAILWFYCIGDETMSKKITASNRNVIKELTPKLRDEVTDDILLTAKRLAYLREKHPEGMR